MKRLRIGTQNLHKLREFEAILAPLGYEVLGTTDLNNFSVDEDGQTFAANALKKAHALFSLTGEPALADDSGLEVDALAGAPGVHSARYSGAVGQDQDASNRQKLLAALKDVPHAERTARFRCVLAYVTAQGEQTFDGTLPGHIAQNERGTGGFGYDSIFLVDAYPGKTLAEILPSAKNAISHRGQATQALLSYLLRQ